MNFLRAGWLLGIVSLLFTAGALQAQRVHTPAAGSDERKAIMDAIRVPCERDLKQEVVFNVEILRVCDGWAYVYAAPQTPENHDINWARTRYAEEYKNGGFDPHGQALLRLQRDGTWKVVHWILGGMDSALPAWINDDGAPEALTPPGTQ